MEENLRGEVTSLEVRLNALAIRDDHVEEDVQAIAEFRRAAIALGKKIDASFDPIIAAQKAALDRAKAEKAKLMDPVEAVKRRAAEVVNAHERKRREIEAANRAAEEKARREEEERRRKHEAEQEKARASHKKLPEPPKPVAPPAVTAPPPSVRMAGAGVVVRKVWKVKLVDESLVPREFMAVDMVRVRKRVIEIGDKAAAEKAIPGVEAWQESDSAFR